MDTYGTCCVCGKPDAEHNLFQMDYKNPVKSESGWGCVVCDLPAEGAVAVVCDACLNEHGSESIFDRINTFMDGPNRRILVPEAKRQIPHKHDLSKHNELNILN